MPLLKYKRLAHKNQIASKKNFERWGFNDMKKNKHGRHLSKEDFNVWLTCQEENGDSCPTLDTIDQAYWNCYAFDEGCDSDTVESPDWYDCYWLNVNCPDDLVAVATETGPTWDAYLDCQEQSGRAASKPEERE